MATWEIYLFGPPRVEQNKQPLAISRRKTVALLAYLAVDPKAYSRETLAALMWPEHTAAQAKANLRRDLSRLKNVLDEKVLLIDRNQAALDPDGDWRLDVETFKQHVQLIRNHNHFPEYDCPACLQAAEEASGLYTADFMAGFTLPDSPEFDEWQFFTRENLRQALADLLQRLIGRYTTRGKYEEAAEYGRRWLAMDTLHEPAHRQLMRLYGWLGQQAAAIRQYEECVRLLDEQLGVEPEPETTLLYKDILARRLPPPVIEKVERPQPEQLPAKATPAGKKRYEVGDLLAEGGHGEVYLGRDLVTDTPVVIKRIKPELLTAESELLHRFQQEGEILARLNHPNIVQMLDTYQHRGQYHIVMEYVPGGSLRRLLKQQRQLEAGRAVAIALELADALGRAHHLGIIHRDLKPENILMAEDGTPRLTDFGVAHLKRADSRLTRTGTILGSPNYISPETIQEGQIDGRSDIWSLGVVLYEMLVGKPPFESSQIVTVLFNIVNETETSLLELLPNLPISLVNLIHNMLKKEPEKRPASMRQVAAVLEAIQEGRIPEHPAVYLTPPKELKVPEREKAAAPALDTPHFLPHQTTSFVGREEELVQIHRLLVGEASCRLLTLVGPDGIGKTRLALEAAAGLLDAFPDGVYFVSLASVGTADFIIPAIAEALRLQFSGPATPKAQLIHYLRPKKMLLVADHLEQPLEGGQIITQLLRLAPQVTFLVTLRERLLITEEWSYEVGGLALPEKPANDPAVLERFSAPRLFLQRAQRARADFAPREEDTAAILEICRLLNCSPLALELAAPWLRTDTLEEIAAGINDSLEALAGHSGSGDYLSHKAVFAQCWRRLTTAEQETLRRLAVFRGGCTREAAAEITGASIQTLNTLMDKALIHQESSGRYDLHPLIRRFAAEKLESDPEEHEVIFDIHCRYFLSFLEQQTPALKTDREQQVLTALTAAMDNLRAAWEWAVEYLLLEDLISAAPGYWLLHQLRGLLFEGETTFRWTAESLINDADSELDSSYIEQIAGFIKCGQGDLMARRGWLAEGIVEIESGLEMIRQGDDFDPLLESFALTGLAAARLFQGHFGESWEAAEEALELLPKRGERWARAVCLQLLGSAAQFQGRLETAEEHFRSCLEICREIGEHRIHFKAKAGLSYINRMRGNYGRAQQWLDEAQELNRSLNNPSNRADLLREQGILALERGQIELAVTVLEESQAISEALSRNDGGMTDVYLGRCLHLQHDLERANDLYQRGLAAAKAAEYEPGVALALHHLGLVALGNGQFTQAEQYLQDALVIWQEVENEPMIAQLLLSLGEVTVQAGETRAADSRSYFRQVLRLAVRHQLAPTGLKAILGLVPLLVRSGEIHQALRLLMLTEQHPASPYEVSRDTREYLKSFPQDEVEVVRRESITLDWIETAEALITAAADAVWGQKPVHHNLPAHRSAFFGRQKELAEIQSHVLETNCRLISIIGPGGIGKTRLGTAAGAALASHFPQGVFLIPLAPLETAEQILITLAEILDVRNLIADNPKPQLLNYLKRKRMLLIFDNYEHLLPQVDLISDILETAPDITIIVTTRQRLNLGAELVFTLRGMSYPGLHTAEPDKLAGYDAVQLLLDHAQLVRPEAKVQPEDYRHIVRICNLVQGMPLALVLAANWLDMLSFAEIAEEIALSLDFLESERGDLPPRQRSVRAVFNSSWSRLPQTAQETFARLSVFRGGFTREAARAVCKTSLRDLRTLVNSSFVTVSAAGRYEVHELMRQLGAEQLEAMGSAGPTKSDHSSYYLGLLKKQEADIKGHRQIEALEEILEEFDNVRSAWNWALKQGDRQAIDLGQEYLHLFFDVQGRYTEGWEFFTRTKEALAPPSGGKPDLTYGRVLTRRAFLGSMIGRPKELLAADLNQGLEIALEHGDELEIAINNLALGHLHQTPSDTLERFERARTIFEKLNDNFYLIRAYVAISNYQGVLLNQQEVKKNINEAVRIGRATGNVINLALAVGNLAEIELAFGKYDLAQHDNQEALSLGRKIHGWLLVSFSQSLSGFIALLAGDLETAERDARGGLAQAEEVDHRYLKALSLAVLSTWAGLTGQTESGLKWGKESHGIAENNMMGLIIAPWGLSINYARLGRWEEAAQFLVTAFQQAQAQQLPAPLVWLMAPAALIAVEKGQPEAAARYLSIAQNHPFSATGWMRSWPRLAGLETALREQLGEVRFEAAWSAGKGCDEEMLPPPVLDELYRLLNSA